MIIQVDKKGEGVYVACCSGYPFDTVVGSTPEEAIANMEERIQKGNTTREVFRRVGDRWEIIKK